MPKDEMKLPASGDLAALTLDKAADAVFWVDARAVFHRVNQAACSSLGYSRDELLAMTLRDIDPEFDESAWKGFWARVKARKSLTWTGIYRTRGGGDFAFEASSNFIRFGRNDYVCSFVRDISERRPLTVDFARSEEYLEKVINSIGDAIFVKDRHHRWVLLNDAFCAIMGRSREELIGKSDFDFFPEAEAKVFWEKDEEVFHSGRENLNEEVITEASGVKRIILTKKTLYRDQHGDPFIVGLFRDITRRKLVEEKLKETLDKVQSLSLTDELTGLYNRRGFVTLSQQHLKLARRNASSLALIYLDLDHMKAINDTHGHSAGDEALKATAELLRKTLRESDILGRIGGDEFVAMGIQVNENGVAAIRRHLQASLDNYNAQSGRAPTLSFSLGAALFDPAHPDSITTLLEKADEAMYREKRARSQ